MNRRHVLQHALTLSGASLLTPFLRLSANAQALPPARRFVLFLVSNGLSSSYYRPAAIGARPKALTETDVVLAPIFDAFRPFQEDFTVVEGLHNPFQIDLHGNRFASTSVTEGPSDAKGAPGGISIDRYLANSLSGKLPFKSVNLATVWFEQEAMHRISDGPRVMFPAEVIPKVSFEKVFGGFSPIGGEQGRAARLRREKKLIDFVKADADVLRKQLGGFEVKKLDQYMQSLSELERRVASVPSTATQCQNIKGSDISQRGPGRTASDATIDAQIDLGVQALACERTNVVSISFGTSEGGISHISYEALKYKESHHVYCHAGHREALLEIQRTLYGKIARFWNGLKAVPEASGSMADSTLLLIVNDGGGAHHDGHTDFAQLYLAGKNVPLKRGRFITLPSAQRANDGAWLPQHCVSDLYCALAESLGVTTPTFGAPQACRGPLAAVRK